MLYYNITSETTVSVVNPGWTQYSSPTGILEIPSTVENAGTTYQVTAIGQDAFSLCTGLSGVVVPEGVVSIGTFAFYNCTSLASITLPSTLEEIRSQAFNTTAFIDDSTNWDTNGLLYIGAYLIASRAELDSVISIKDSTFGLAAMSLYYNQSIRVVQLPSTLRFIGDLAFSDCSLIDTIQVAAEVPPSVTFNSFDNTPDFIVKVPCNMSSSYESHAIWGQHTIEEYGCTDPNPPDPPNPPGPTDPTDPNDDIDVWTEEGGLVIHVSEGAEIYVFDIGGHVLFHAFAESNVVRVPLNCSGVYIVRREDTPFPALVPYWLK